MTDNTSRDDTTAPEHHGALDRVKEALHNDLAQTEHNMLPGEHGHQLHQTVGDTVRQMLGKQDPDRVIDDEGIAPHHVLGYSDSEDAEIEAKVAAAHDGIAPTTEHPTV